MVTLTLKGCKHPMLRAWDVDGEVMHVTCLVCYERLVAREDHTVARRYSNRDNSDLPHDVAAPFCEHRSRQVLEKGGRHMDAWCADCGVVLRHPDGPGEWVEVLFNGYVIREEP